jgi:dTDP-4-amino-4,6-dideoxygalactose transaminase
VSDRIDVMRPSLGQAELDAVAETVRSGWVAQGPRVAEFEQRFAEAVGAEYAVALSSCTAGLHLSLVAAGIGPGDDVVVPSFSFIATANAVRYVGARPVFADVAMADGNLPVDTVAAAVTGATRAVVVVHQGGVPADVGPLREWCDARGLVLVEDAACAVGSTYEGRPVGAGARIAAWSFHPRKLITTGEGGMVTTDDAAWAGRIRRLREHAMSVSAADRHLSAFSPPEQYLETGFNYRMTDLQASLGLVQLGRLPELVARRRQIAERYRRALRTVPGIRPVVDPPWGTSNVQSFWVELTAAYPLTREELLRELADSGIAARRGIMASHLQPAYQGHPCGPLTHTRWLSANTLILPVFHDLTEAQQDHVVATIRQPSVVGRR